MTRHVGGATADLVRLSPESGGRTIPPGRAYALLRLQCEITHSLIDAERPEDAVTAAIRAICQAEGWTAGHYWRLDRDALRIDVAWSQDDDGRHDALDLGSAPGVELARDVLRSSEVSWTRSDNALLVSVACHGRTMGVLQFTAPSMAEPDAGLRQVIHTLARQIGDVCGRAAVLHQLRESEEHYASMVELAAIGISHVDLNGRFLHVNRQLCEMLGYSREELLGLSVKQITHPEDQLVTTANLILLHAGQIDSFKAEKRYLRKNGTPIWVSLTVASNRAADTQTLHDVSIIEDISARHAAEERIQYMATHDELTGLTNRAVFGQLLTHAVQQSRRYRRSFAVLFLDLDRFKTINDSLGHDGGDQLLTEISRRIRCAVRSTDAVARFGGDEFVILAELPDREAAAVVARNLLRAVTKPLQVLGQDCRVTVSVGITMCPDDAQHPADLLKNADLAMYVAKEAGKNNFQFFSPEISKLSGERHRIEACLNGALERGEISMHYQAKVDLKTGRINGVEALMRWTHPELGIIPPVTFIPIAEDGDLILELGRWAIERACTQGAAWLGQGLPPMHMAVNLSPRQFKDAGLLNHLTTVLAETGMPPELLEIEITESMMMTDVEGAVAKLSAIRELGVRLAIDDFGTGYSSLAQLKRFPIDTLKVDRSFIRDIPDDAGNNAITEAIIALGRSLGVTVVAEGVETLAQQTFLQTRSCDEMQGYIFSKPVPADEFAELLRTYTPAPRSTSAS